MLLNIIFLTLYFKNFKPKIVVAEITQIAFKRNCIAVGSKDMMDPSKSH